MTISVIVADSSKAKFLFTMIEHGPLQDDRDYVHPESRLQEQDLNVSNR